MIDVAEIETRILIVEDEARWQKAIMRCDFLRQLRKRDANSVIVVSNYEEAEKKILSHHFDIAITDLALEGANSRFEWRSLARLLQQEHIPVVVVSGYLNDTNILCEMVNEYNVVGLFHKADLDPQKLSEHLQKILTKPKTHVASPALMTEQSDVTVLHLSDLHCGPEHRFARRYSNDLTRDDVPDLASAIISDVKQQALSIDTIVISGDLSHSGEIEDFVWARDLINQLMADLGLSKDQVLVIPGNHDVKWVKEQEKMLPAHEPTRAYQTFYELLYGRPVKDSKRLYHTVFIPGKNLLVVGLDSCVIEEEKTAGIGYVGPHQLSAVLSEVRELTQIHPDCIKIAVLHHHLLPVEEIRGLPAQGKNFSLVMDASSVLRRLYQEDFVAVLHGHQHQPYCVDLRLYGQGISRTTPIVIAGAGSIGAKREDLGAIARNHYSIVQIQTAGLNRTVRVIGRISSDQNENEFQMYDEQVITLSGVTL